jgi:hypothetical protein
MALNLTLDIDFEFADKITVTNLKDSYERIQDEIRELEARDNLQPWQKEDYESAKKNRKAIKKVLRYFMNHTEAQEYFNEQ